MRDTTLVHIETDIGRCEACWNRHSPKKSLYDLWEFRLPFWKIFRFEPHFIILKQGDDETGMLPLWQHPEQKCFYWFGDTGDEMNWQEDNAFWARTDEDVSLLLKACPRPAVLNLISRTCFERWHHLIPMEPANPKSMLSLSGIRCLDDYLLSLSKKLRSNLRRDQRAIDALHPIIARNDPSHFEHLIRLNTAKFASSPLHNMNTVNAFRDILRTAGSRGVFDVTILAVKIGDDIAAVDLVFVCNDTSYPLLCGSDTERFPGIGHYMTLRDIEDALERDLSSIDFAEDAGNDNYKHRLFATLPQYRLSLHT